MSRQLAVLTSREQKQAEELAARRQQEQVDMDEVEEALISRLASTYQSSAPPEQEAAGRAVAKLTIVEGPSSGHEFVVSSFPATLGAAEWCDVVLPGLDAEQARLLYRDGRFELYELAGRAGGAETPLWVLEPGDDVTIGPYRLHFTAELR
jgi:hypothetical protein